MSVQYYLDVNTQHCTLEAGRMNVTPLVLLNNLANVKVNLYLQPIHLEIMSIAHTIKARLPGPLLPTDTLTAKLGCDEIGKNCHVSRMCLRFYQ